MATPLVLILQVSPATHTCKPHALDSHTKKYAATAKERETDTEKRERKHPLCPISTTATTVLSLLITPHTSPSPSPSPKIFLVLHAPTPSMATATTTPISVTICFLIYIISMATPSIEVSTTDTLYPHQPLVNNRTLVSANQRFELGFFRPSPNLTARYLGIWYKDVDPITVVWIAKRIKPLKKPSARLVLDDHGSLTIQEGNRTWNVAPRAKEAVVRPTLQLLDTGNLVIRDSRNNVTDRRRYIWESFNYPADTLLPGMKLGWDFVTDVDRVMTSWKNSDDPSDGEFTFRFDSPGSPQLVLIGKNMVHRYRWGPWDGSRFSGINNAFKPNAVYKPVFISSPNEISLMFEVLDDTVLFRFTMDYSGSIQLLKWKNKTKSWIQMARLNKDYCDQYGLCGPNGVCHPNEPRCRCLQGFEVNSPQEWHRLDFTGGCKRKYNLNCSRAGDGFIKYDGLKVPDYSILWKNLSPDECGEKCLKDCNCMAYTNLDLYGNGSQCIVWMSDLIDVEFLHEGGDEIYIRMAKCELDLLDDAKKEKEGMMVIASFLATITAISFMCLVVWHTFHIKKDNIQGELSNNQDRYSMESHEEDFDFHIFDMDTISAATNDFSLDNKIGQGGFGIVYKGELGMGQEIAVKRLLENSWQGLREFNNEVSLIARLQHRNLVKLLGYCIQGEEKLLVYEYLPNRSLDQFLFDQARKRILTWQKRLNIITEVAKGLVYLHDDSRLRIIHRDLKASNILLDSEMNPKISDFGVARIFAEGVEETTRRVIGTHGYMPPEYIMSGHFSTRSDVFSFGVLALEIISGKKNWGFHHPDHDMNLIGHAWKLWSEGRPMELIDTQLEEGSFSESEMLRCIQVSLLCVQQRATDRPTMSNVVDMLRSEVVTVPEPLEPGFFTGRSSYAWHCPLSGGREPLESINDLTITTLSGR